jgi:signal transduction histidine kinase
VASAARRTRYRQAATENVSIIRRGLVARVLLPAGDDRLASVRVEWLIWLAFCLIRAVTLVQATVALTLGWGEYRNGAAVAALLSLLTADSALVAVMFRRSGRCGTARIAADACMTVISLVVTALALKPSANPYVDNVVYPYSVAAMVLVGAWSRRLLAVVIVPALACAAYVASTLARFAFHPELLMNAATYWLWSVLAFVLFGMLRWLSASLDSERRRAVEVAQRQERAEAARSLHDHVLQTMEVVARDDWVPDERLRRQIAAEVVWLRSWLDGKLDCCPNDLVTALARIARDQAADGLRVELNAAGMNDRVVSRAVVEAVSGAVAEALANVRKHAGVTEAVVRAVRDEGRVVVTITDRGRGFDPDRHPLGFGLRNCVIERVREAGGVASVSSVPGGGTQIGLSVPPDGRVVGG